jgi:hypothetical protein
MARDDLRCVHISHHEEVGDMAIGAGVTRKAVLWLMFGCSKVEWMAIGSLTYATPRRAVLAACLTVGPVSHSQGRLSRR